MKLYVYDHCPYCVKARMIFGFKQIPFELITLADDDIKTPTSMIGVKMTPILEKDSGEFHARKFRYYLLCGSNENSRNEFLLGKKIKNFLHGLMGLADFITN